jgi:hypothetical protein
MKSDLSYYSISHSGNKNENLDELTVEVKVIRLHRKVNKNGFYTIDAEYETICPCCNNRNVRIDTIMEFNIKALEAMSICEKCGSNGKLITSEINLKHKDEFSDIVSTKAQFICNECNIRSSPLIRYFIKILAIVSRNQMSEVVNSNSKCKPLHNCFVISNRTKKIDIDIGDTLLDKLHRNHYDTFLCYNSEYRPAVKKIGEMLKLYGILPWLDEWNIRPGIPWQREIEKQLNNIASATVFVGGNGVGPWQRIEIESILDVFIKRGCPVIPVLLEDCSNKPNMPLFMKNLSWIDFAQKDPDPIRKLVWGITGNRAL